MRSRRRLGQNLPLPAHPYRSSAVFYGVLALLIVLVALLTGGRVPRAVAFAVAFFVVATGWSWWRFRKRMEEERRGG